MASEHELSSTHEVRTGSLDGGGPLPLVIEPATAEIDAADWARRHRSGLERELLHRGAILFRGFPLGAAEAFEGFARTLCPDLFHENGEHPREAVSGSVYTPVFFPPTEKLLWHNENSFDHRWPMRIWFGCVRPADRGGETPIVDSRQVFARLAPRLRDRFRDRGVRYVRNYGTGLGLSWQTVFQTSDRSEVERRCRENRLSFEWKDEDALRTSCVRPAVIRHPRTGEETWFNQAQHWHLSCLDAETRESLETLFAEEDLPRNCYYGDGSTIEDAAMREILDVYQDLEVSFSWRRGDVLMLDNLLTAHGRNPFSGERKLLVALGEMGDFDSLP